MVDPTNRSIGPFVDDERGLEREADGEGFAKRTEGGVWGRVHAATRAA